MTRQSTIGFIVGVLFTAAVYGTFVKPTVMFNVEAPPARKAAVEQSLPKLSAADEGLLARLTPHLERMATNVADRRLEAVADELNHIDADGKKFGEGEYGAVGGTVLAVALGTLIKKMIVAIVTAMILAIILKVLWAKIGWVIAFYFIGFVLPCFVTALVTAKVVAGGAVNRLMLSLNLRK